MAAVKRSSQLLPSMLYVVAGLGWQASAHGSVSSRFDQQGVECRFELGVDTFSLLLDWLVEVRRQRALANCGRVVTSLHRQDDPELAQWMVFLGVPTGGVRCFEGHLPAFHQRAHGTNWLLAAASAPTVLAFIIAFQRKDPCTRCLLWLALSFNKSHLRGAAPVLPMLATTVHPPPTAVRSASSQVCSLLGLLPRRSQKPRMGTWSCLASSNKL